MKCKLCTINEPDKKNTHFLSDSIIRICLNENGENIREKGFYFDVSNDKAFIDFNFQRRTSYEKLTETLGREPSDEEITKAKEIPFSVDYVFCSECEKKFTEIEEKFTHKYLEDFRSNKYKDLSKLEVSDYKIIKSFFILQVWRTAVADPSLFTISKDVHEDLRDIILNNSSIDASRLDKYPVFVTYLSTIDEKNGHTGNFVGYTSDENPNLIIMNDFVIQFFPGEEQLKYFDFYNLNNPQYFEEFKNIDSSKFTFKILSDEQRRVLLYDIMVNDKIKALTEFYAANFKRLWFTLFGFYPTNFLTSQYMSFIIQDSKTNLLHYTFENILKLTEQFIAERVR